LLLLDRPCAAEAAMPMTLDEYLALPEDTRCEIVDGVPRPLVRPNKVHREVQHNLTHVLKVACPPDLAVSEEEVVTFSASPPHARIPDVVVYRADADPTGRRNHTAPADVLLVAEVVSESTQTADRYEKPAEYARAGVPAFWRVELDPEIVVWTYRLLDGVYHDQGQFAAGDQITDPELPWISVEVTGLLGRFAPKA
jgi:Uma2 family endonuclease